MNNKFVILVVAVLFWSCGPTKTEAPVNQLTEQQKTDGWKILFDGQTMNGWRAFKNKESNSWEVVDGTFHCKPYTDGVELNRTDLVTNDSYQNFELAFDWKISAKGNSGVMFRVTEEYEVSYASGPEYQVVDDAGPGELPDVNKAGGNFAMHAPGNKTMNPAGEWNSGKLVVNGNHVEHWLNGSKVVEYELASDDWKKLVNGSKWKDFPGYGLASSGFIALQDHGNEVWYRNVFIKVL